MPSRDSSWERGCGRPAVLHHHRLCSRACAPRPPPPPPPPPPPFPHHPPTHTPPTPPPPTHPPPPPTRLPLWSGFGAGAPAPTSNPCYTIRRESPTCPPLVMLLKVELTSGLVQNWGATSSSRWSPAWRSRVGGRGGGAAGSGVEPRQRTTAPSLLASDNHPVRLRAEPAFKTSSPMRFRPGSASCFNRFNRLENT